MSEEVYAVENKNNSTPSWSKNKDFLNVLFKYSPVAINTHLEKQPLLKDLFLNKESKVEKEKLRLNNILNHENFITAYDSVTKTGGLNRDLFNRLTPYEVDLIDLFMFDRSLNNGDLTGIRFEYLNNLLDKLTYGKPLAQDIAVEKFSKMVDTYISSDEKSKPKYFQALQTALKYMPKQSEKLYNFGINLFDKVKNIADPNLIELVDTCVSKGTEKNYLSFLKSKLKPLYSENKKKLEKMDSYMSKKFASNH